LQPELLTKRSANRQPGWNRSEHLVMASGTRAKPMSRWPTSGSSRTKRRAPARAIPGSRSGICLPCLPGSAQWSKGRPRPSKAALTKRRSLSGFYPLKSSRTQAPISLRLLPATFTLSELQQMYELLLGKRLHKASFRRALQAAWLVEPMDEWRSEGRGRPAQLFRYLPKKRRRAHRGVRFDFLYP